MLNNETTVAVMSDSAYRFDINNMTPTWTLWIGEVPTVQEGLSARSEMILSKLSSVIRQAEAKQAQPPQKEHKPVSRSERVRLLEQAQREELRGNLVHAAELLEQAGYPGPAGRLYERAAATASASR